MTRRVAVGATVAGLAVAGCGGVVATQQLTGHHHPATERTHAATTVTVGGRATGPPEPNGFVGVSLEYNGVEPYAGTDPHAVNPLFVRLLDRLAPKGDLTVRIGGDSGDLTWYPAPGIKPPAQLWYTLNQKWFQVTKALAQESGAGYILDLNLLAHNNNLAVSEARALLAGVGREHIKAFEIGNEPEYYSVKARDGLRGRPRSYHPREFGREAASLAKLLPPLPIADPASGNPHWITTGLIDSVPRLKVITFHRYPLNNCLRNSRDPAYPSVQHLLDPRTTNEITHGLAPYIDAAHDRGMAFRVDELNSVTCLGREGVSDSFAAALWTAGSLMQMAANGVDGVNFHMHPEAVAGQLFTFSHDHGQWTASVNPAYYGITLFNDAAPAGSRALPVHETGATKKLHAWAVQTRNGQRNVVLVNDSEQTLDSVTLRVPAGTGSCTVARLTAPSAMATGGVTLAGQSFGPNASLTGRKTTTTTPVRNGACRVNMPPASAAEVTL